MFLSIDLFAQVLYLSLQKQWFQCIGSKSNQAYSGEIINTIYTARLRKMMLACIPTTSPENIIFENLYKLMQLGLQIPSYPNSIVDFGPIQNPTRKFYRPSRFRSNVDLFLIKIDHF